MRLLIDTSVIVALIRDDGAAGDVPASHLARVADDVEVVLSSIVAAELAQGFCESARTTNERTRFDVFSRGVTSHTFGFDAAEWYGRVRTLLRKAGTAVGTMDELIAAHALALGADVATLNAKDFARIPGLKVLDWSRPAR